MDLKSLECMVANGTITSEDAASLKLIMANLPENERDLLQLLVALTILRDFPPA